MIKNYYTFNFFWRLDVVSSNFIGISNSTSFIVSFFAFASPSSALSEGSNALTMCTTNLNSGRCSTVFSIPSNFVTASCNKSNKQKRAKRQMLVIATEYFWGALPSTTFSAFIKLCTWRDVSNIMLGKIFF